VDTQRSTRVVNDAKDGDVGQTDEERAHARRVNFHRGSERSAGVRTADSLSPCAAPGGPPPTPLHPAQLRSAIKPGAVQ
jgi:hypothetical protein